MHSGNISSAVITTKLIYGYKQTVDEKIMGETMEDRPIKQSIIYQ